MSRREGTSRAKKRRADEMVDDLATQADLMFGPAGAQLPVLSQLTYNVTQNLTGMTDVPSLNGTQVKINVKLEGLDIISGLKALYRTGDVTRPYPKHVQKMASLGKSEVKVKVNCGSDAAASGSGSSE